MADDRKLDHAAQAMAVADRIDHMRQLLVEHGHLNRRQLREYAELHGVSKRTAQRDRKEALRDLAEALDGPEGDDGPTKSEQAALALARSELLWRDAREGGRPKIALEALRLQVELLGLKASAKVDVTVTDERPAALAGLSAERLDEVRQLLAAEVIDAEVIEGE